MATMHELLSCTERNLGEKFQLLCLPDAHLSIVFVSKQVYCSEKHQIQPKSSKWKGLEKKKATAGKKTPYTPLYKLSFHSHSLALHFVDKQK